MKTKNEILNFVHTDLVMKSKTISHIILEGCNGVGKTTLLLNLLKAYNYSYVVYDRGELSNFVYAKKYNRQFTSLQRNLPFLYILLTCDENELAKRIRNRAIKQHWSDEELSNELNKISEQKEFISAAKDFENDFHILTVDTTGLDEHQTCQKVKTLIDDYVSKLPTDKDETKWNEMYRKACNLLGYKFEVRNNQPYINGKMFMSESTWQNGAYETFTDKTCADNLLFSLGYSKSCHYDFTSNKTLDFAYVINSKINRRHEIIDYYFEMLKHDKTCLVSEKIYDAFENENFIKMKRAFGDDFINELKRAKATIYCARDLEYLKLQTARMYEAAISGEVMFVDKESDKNCDMLKLLYQDRQDIIDLLYVTPDTFIDNYEKVFANQELVDFILHRQLQYYYNLVKGVFDYE